MIPSLSIIVNNNRTLKKRFCFRKTLPYLFTIHSYLLPKKSGADAPLFLLFILFLFGFSDFVKLLVYI